MTQGTDTSREGNLKNQAIFYEFQFCLRFSRGASEVVRSESLLKKGY